ncbi:phage/plasmid primase, P4 family [Pirellulaceae bacterium]|nr:phage/plasmid primase, P4 family [Pirellulaceae bacterium]
MKILNKNDLVFYETYEFPIFEVIRDDKRPLKRGWRKSTDIPKGDYQKFAAMIAKGSNLGAAIPERILVLDFDERSGGLESLKQLNEELGFDLLESGPVVCTPNSGYHVYCSCDCVSSEIRGKLDSEKYPGVDIRKHGNYVVAPPSSIDSRSYVWHPNCLDANGVVKVAPLPLPKLLVDIVTAKKKKKRTSEKAASSKSSPTSKQCDGAIDAKDVKVILEQLDVSEFRNRDDWFRLMASLHSASAGDKGACKAFVGWSAGDPPYADSGCKVKHTSEWNGLSPDGGFSSATLIQVIKNNTEVTESEELQQVIDKIKSHLMREDFEVYDGSESLTSDSSSSSLSWMRNEQNWTENVLSAKFVEQCGSKFRYSPESKLWYKFDETMWEASSENVYVGQEARQFVKELWNFMKEVGEEWNGGRLAKLTTFIRQANSTRGIEQMIKLSKCDSQILVKGDYWDQAEHLLNVKNGTIDLKTGILLPHNPNDHITLMADVSFDKDADCPRWEAAMDMFFDGNQELMDYVKTLIGYLITGYCGEPILPTCFGPLGGNGKSTIGNVIQAILGDYGYTANETLLTGQSENHPTELKSLKGKRFVVINEPDAGSVLRVGRVKALTGDTTITARGMHENNSQFKRTAKFMIVCNHLPKIPGGDEGLFRRVVVIPFDVKIADKTKPDPNFIQYLIKNEGRGILNWCISGFQDYQQNGFIEPDCVSYATQSYKHGEDHVARFLAENCMESPGGSIGLQEAFDRFKEFMGGFDSLTKREFSSRLGTKFKKTTPRSGPNINKVVFNGIRFKDEGEEFVTPNRSPSISESGSGTTAI